MNWSGTDDPLGSGTAFFDVFVSDNPGAPGFTIFQTQTIATSATFTGQLGHTYGFFSVATNNVGHQQATPAGAQTTTTLADPGPQVLDIRLTVAGKGVTGAVLTFDQQMNTGSAQNTANYSARLAGKDKKFGTRDDVPLTVQSAVYDDALKQVTLSGAGTKPLKLGQLIEITAKGGGSAGGIMSASGTALDGDANDAPGGDFSRGLGAGTKLSYIDANGDTVALSLKKGGLMELAVPTTGNPTLRLSGTVAGTSTLTGSVKKPKAGGGDGRTSLASITGSAGVNRTGLPLCTAQVTSNCFSVSSISAAVVDALLESDDL